MRYSVFALLVIPSALTGCATLTVDQNRIQSVRTVAVVGYTAYWQPSSTPSQSRTTNPVGARANAIKSITRAATGEAQAVREERAVATYDRLVSTLSEKMGWTVLDLAALDENADYQERVEARGRHPGGGVFSAYNHYLFVEGVLKHEDVYRMSPDERRQLMDTLGVDAIANVLIRFNVEESGFAVGGLGNRRQHPVATVEFQLYDRHDDQPIWVERAAKGRRAEQMMSQEIAGVSVDRETVAAVVEAAEYGYEELIARCRRQQQP